MKAGLIGLGVMGRNLALNLRDKGHEVFATDSWESARQWTAPGITVVRDTAALADALAGDIRVVLLMVKAGDQVDNEIDNLCRVLSPGDIIIDGGNSLFTDTERRSRDLGERGLGYLGCGISGGAEGARHGAAIMVGGAESDWLRAKPLLTSFAATAGRDGAATVDYFGAGGAGHFVKMVHNGIEYAIMQAIAEAHALLRDAAGLEPDAIADTMRTWATKGEAAGFLLEITADIANTRDAVTGGLLLPVIDDAAGQKGTGSWTVKAALDTGVAASAIMEAVAARQLSGNATTRAVMQAAVSERPQQPPTPELVPDIEQALAGAMVIALAQGTEIYTEAARAKRWSADKLADVLRVWRAGSILRMSMLDELADALDAKPEVDRILALPDVATRLARRLPAWRKVATAAIATGTPATVLTSSLGYVDALSTPHLPTAVVQAQRDRFGAHGFRRRDRDGDHHGPWVQPDAEASAQPDAKDGA